MIALNAAILEVMATNLSQQEAPPSVEDEEHNNVRKYLTKP
jgi:hypothetical protein